MKKKGKKPKSKRLKKLEEKLSNIEKAKNYLQTELSKTSKKEKETEEKISKEKKAIRFSNKAKKLHSSKK